ncbi:MAG: carbohydrate ABC transporter permease [Chloroflexi bacterium]|nr:carbohydrate ABC transporter permease [Chloroflexota bacterium]
MISMKDVLASKSSRDKITTAVVYIVLSAGAIIFLIPFIWMLSTSFKSLEEVWVIPPKWIPDPILWKNYIDALTVMPFLKYTVNTLIITVGTIIGTLFSASLVAYGFSRLRFPGRDVLFVLLLATMMIPGQVTLIPQFILFKYMGWIDTFWPLIIPNFFAVNAFAVFLLRQFFMSIPIELDEAATLDGCSPLTIYWKIILPLSKPALGTLAIFVFMFCWNDFLGPLIYINSMDKRTIALGLNSFLGMYGGDWNLMMAASVIFLLPCLVIFFLAQKAFVQGIVVGGIKG